MAAIHILKRVWYWHVMSTLIEVINLMWILRNETLIRNYDCRGQMHLFFNFKCCDYKVGLSRPIRPFWVISILDNLSAVSRLPCKERAAQVCSRADLNGHEALNQNSYLFILSRLTSFSQYGYVDKFQNIK
jgi:hypothetical protein